MRSRSATTGFIVEASCMLRETVGVLSDLECGATMHVSGTASRRVASWRTRAASYRSGFVVVTLIFFNETKSAMMSGGQGCHQTRM